MFTGDPQHAVPCCAGGGGLKSASRDHCRHPRGFDRCERTLGFCEGMFRVISVDERCWLFFRLWFRQFATISNFLKKGAGPGASEKPFGSSERLLISGSDCVEPPPWMNIVDFSDKCCWSRCFAKAFWRHPRAAESARRLCWEGSGSSGSVLGGSWAVLRRSRSTLGTI